MSDEGRLVAGRYRVQRRIGSGAMGVVWECVDERLHRTVAVKQLLLQPGLDPGEAEEARQRAMREGRIAARLQHSNAISVYDVAEDEGQPVLVMEYLPSTSLAAMMSDHGPLPPREVARIGAEVASALGAAHAAGVVHRDIKPGNILLGDNGQVKITDFGISRAQGDVQVTKTGMLAGTPAYLSPDVAMGQEPTPASDVFSLGATLYAAIEGHPPFGLNENTLALLHAVAAGKIEPPQQAGPMAQPLMAMMAARVQDRPDMAQSREMLQAVADGGSVNSIPTMAAPIPPALAPETPEEATSVMGAGAAAGTTVAYYEDDPYTERPYEDATSYMGADPRADSAVYEEPRRSSKRPVIISAIALVAVAVIAVLVTSALRPQAPPPQPANQQSEAPQAPAPPPETTSEETTTSKKPTRTSTEEPTTSAEEPTTSSEEPTSTEQPTSSAEQTSSKPTSTTTSQSGSITTQ
ncbi:serine/threonine-protein kinase [Saccharopolyspora sp. TS4A08]|uniref:non-specific serine/threonine protein kinase n=1 Tax=Saccharopolyspora ipomoeae TaxID=3042027 RepID=A0ABT6PLP8_9PSEU|nr:serine/threonine-protein kinase [Saccharopolyspora sp. TS4A08]MDI2028930.1 serine/threonine-protein kinase [Saccharopolyspora sp. TS4A08]